MSEARELYRLSIDYGRHGKIEGLFVAPPEDVRDALGQEIYLGDVLGKHSDIAFDLKAAHLREVQLDDDTLDALLEAFGHEAECSSVTLVGYNPLEYLEDA